MTLVLSAGQRTTPILNSPHPSNTHPHIATAHKNSIDDVFNSSFSSVFIIYIYILCFYLYDCTFGFIFFVPFCFVHSSIQIMCNRLMSVLLSSPSPSSSPLLSSLSLSSAASLKFLIYLVILFATDIQSIEAFCDEHHWWQEQFGACIPCTVCEDGRQQSIVLRPCQPHSDTICGTLEDVEVELDWLKEAAVAAEHRQVS